MKFKLLKEILTFMPGYIVYIDERDMGLLGRLPWGYEIPKFIIERNPDWFERIDNE